MTRARWGGRPGDGGFTLIELSISMMIISVLAAAVYAVSAASYQAVRISTVKVATGADARLAMETLSRTLRVAVIPAGEASALTVASYDSLSFYALLSRSSSVATTPLPTLVEYYRDASSNCLMEAQTPARVLSAPSGTGSLYAWDTGRLTHCVAKTTQIPTSGSPWFTYYTTGQLLTGASPSTPLTIPTGGLVLSDRQSVRSVQVTLTITDPNSPTITGVSDEVQVTLGNVSLSNGGGA